MARRTKILLLALVCVTVGLVVATRQYFALQDKIAQRLQKGWVLPPLELYAQGFALSVGRQWPQAAVQEELSRRNLTNERDYVFGNSQSCAQLSAMKLKDTSRHCLWIKNHSGHPFMATWDDQGWLQELWAGEPLESLSAFALFPRLITQFYDGQPILQLNTALSEIPLACLQGVTAIEDREFLEHGGVSATGTLRALLRNIRARRWAEGGSTITQQLVKNFFLTSKKTLRRKLEEQALALLLEAQLSKDQILEMYLNVIYMGQSGPYQVRGFGSAAKAYFDKPIAQLTLPECALLAALINNPGRYSPFHHPPQAQARRELVLNKMQEAQMLTAQEVEQAKQTALPPVPDGEHSAHAPYFVMAALKEFTALDLEMEDGARLYTSLDPEMQNIVTRAVQDQLPGVEAKVKHPSPQPLQAAALTVDLGSGEVLALLGGRDFKATQFNRAVDSRRQIGSIVKPFVYWPALQTHDPLTSVQDEPFEWKTGKQLWRPKNFEPGMLGPVPYFYALAHSMNIPAARVGQEVGLDQVANTLRAAGVTQDIPRLPSLTLGALELSPLEVAQAYSTFAHMGSGQHLTTLLRVEDLNGGIVFVRPVLSDLRLAAQPSAVLISMLEQSLILGTARTARAAGLDGAFAGKTGTTSDTKDAWFSGFSPRVLTVVWVGYDDNTVMGLTGAGAALPIWTEITKANRKLFTNEDFHWPEGVEPREIKRDSLLEKFPNLKDLPDSVTLIFPK
jgi:penicillin-binding protein 1B